MQGKNTPRDTVAKDLKAEVQAIQVFSTSIIFSAAAVASSTVLLFIPNLETLSLFFFLVGYRYGTSTGTLTVLTSVTIFEMFASQVYGSGGLFPFLLKFPPFFLIMITGVYFNHVKNDSDSLPLNDSSSISQESNQRNQHSEKILYQPQLFTQKSKEGNFSLYEHILLVQLGLALTVVYDVITSLGILVFVPTWEGFFVTFILGIPFIIFHQVTNAILFATIPAIIMALDRARPIN